jgi:hypothetical protein
VDRRVGRDLGQIKELVGPQPQKVSYFDVHRLERTIQDLAEQEVNRPPMPQNPVAELRRQRPVAGARPLPAELDVQQ